VYLSARTAKIIERNGLKVTHIVKVTDRLKVDTNLGKTRTEYCKLGKYSQLKTKCDFNFTVYCK